MMKLLKMWKKYREVIMYLIFGAATTVVNIVIYMFASSIGMTTALSTVVAWAISVVFAFLTNKWWVFCADTQNFVEWVREFVSFFLGRIATGIIDIAIMVICVDVLFYNEFVMKIVSNVVVIILNYIISKLWVFRKKV